jgi:hypothetical protein
MTTYRDIVNQALRELGVLHGAEVAGAEEGESGLTALNQMLNSWVFDGIDLEHITATNLTDTLPYPDDHHSAFAYNLALRLSPQYGVEPSRMLMSLAIDGYRQLQNRYLVIRPLKADIAITYPLNRPDYIE